MSSTTHNGESGERLRDDSIVISGMAGIYPQANNVKELDDILYNKVNPITKVTWPFKHPETAKYAGVAANMDDFDAQFFNVHCRLSNATDPMARKVLEQTYQAIYDAGMSPEHYKGKNVGVYVATSFSESESKGFFDNILKSSLGIVGSSKAMFANRISYWLNVRGPSVGIEGSCCGGAVAFEQACQALTSGTCIAAVVGACHMCYLPNTSVHYGRATKISPDGKTRSFDENADGFTLSDAINVLFLQKAKDALRVYAEVVSTKTAYTMKPYQNNGTQFSYYRDPVITADFLNRFYKEACIPPGIIEYVEAFGSGIPVADKAELESFDQVFCENRNKPLLVGSVLSNVGYTETATTLTAITKVLLGFEKGLLAGNLHCSTPRQDVAAIREGRIQILQDHHDFNNTYAAVNGLSISGVNSHTLLKRRHKVKNLSRYASNIPRLVTISNRTEEGVKKMFEYLKSHPIDAEELALLLNIHSTNISGHFGRGYTILDEKEQKTISYVEHTEHFDRIKRPLWFVYSGMGSQWPTMGTQLMRIPIFVAAIERCRRVLEPKGIDIVKIITSPDKTMFDNILNSFVGIAAIQIGLTDILFELGLVPDNIIGHSVGELGCAYADGCMTTEEMILSAYSRGLVSLQTPLIRGSMAAIGLGYQEITKLCPPEIEVACHNGPDSSTISGPADIMRLFVKQLTDKGIFAKEVPCSNIAYHSRYISGAGPGLKHYLSEVIKTPKARTDRWLSTSVPCDKWNEPASKYSSAEYHTNNLLSPVLFEETARSIPANAVLIEVAPHGLLQAILKRSLSSNCINIPLTKRGHADNTLFLLDAIGKLYMEGYVPKVEALYPTVEFPVSTGTPLLSPLVDWLYTDNWVLPFYTKLDKKHAAACEYLISVHDTEYQYLQGNQIREKTVFPYAAALIAAWDTLAMIRGETKKKMSVRFNDVHLQSQPILFDQRLLRLKVSVQRVTGWFEITNEYTKIASGYISNQLLVEDSKIFRKNLSESEESMELDSTEIYDLFLERDYFYSGEFCSLHKANSLLTEALLEWNTNWVTLIDGLLQVNTLKQYHDSVSTPIFIRKLVINLREHYNSTLINIAGKTLMKIEVNDIHDITRCGGVLLQNIRFHNLPKKTNSLKLLTPSLTIQNFHNTDISNVNGNINCNESLNLEIENFGNIETLNWIKKDATTIHGIDVKVTYAGLNFSDYINAVGISKCKWHENNYGIDFSGITASGHRVMGLVRGACSTRVRAAPDLLWPVPVHWSLEEAATVPFAYTFAFYCLTVKAGFQPNMNIFVHGGTGTLGQAVISVALAHGCQVFTTVSNMAKKHLLTKLYPDLNEMNIGNSRDTSFGDKVLNITGGRGCDIVISCVKGGLRDMLFKCCGFCGIMVDILHVISPDNFQYRMYNMTKQRSYLTVDFSSIFDPEHFEERRLLQALMCKGIRHGYVRPLSRSTFTMQEVSSAFRFLAEERRHGKVVIHLQDNFVNVQPRIICSANLCQVLFSDGSKLALKLAGQLISRGAKKLYIQTPVLNSHERFKIESWKKLGIEFAISFDIINNETDVKRIIRDSEKFGAIESIYIFMVQNYETQSKIFRSVTIDTDLVTKNDGSVLKYFAVFHSEPSTEKSLSITRRKDSFPATIVNLSNILKELPNSIAIQGEDILNAMESSLYSLNSLPRSVVYQETYNKPSLLQKLQSLTNVKLSNLDNHVTLGEVGMDDTRCLAIQSYLRDTHNIFLTEENIFTMTINRIQQLEQLTTEPEFKDMKGLDNFISKVERNDLLATAEIVPVPTWAHEVTSKDDEFDVSLKYLCIVPGMEGLQSRFQHLCERLKIPAIVLQPGVDRPHETIPEMAERLAQILLEKVRLKDHFYLLGYEMGVPVALEIAAILEKNGLEGTIFCIGYMPDELKLVVNEQLKDYDTEEKLQDEVIRHIYKKILNQDNLVLENDDMVSYNWKDKAQYFVRRLLNYMPIPAQYVTALMETALGRINQICNYKSTVSPLRSRIIFLRVLSKETSSQIKTKKYSQQPIAVHDLTVNLAYATQDMSCAAVINQYLPSEILDAFDKKNLCEIYINDVGWRFEVL